MLLPILCLAAAGVALYAISRRKPRYDACHERSYGDEPYLAREVRRALHPEAYGDAPHCPPFCTCRGGADTGLPFEHRGVGNRGRLNHREAE